MLQSKSARKNLPSHPFWLDGAVPAAWVTKILTVPGSGSQPESLQDETAAHGKQLTFREVKDSPQVTNTLPSSLDAIQLAIILLLR